MTIISVRIVDLDLGVDTRHRGEHSSRSTSSRSVPIEDPQKRISLKIRTVRYVTVGLLLDSTHIVQVHVAVAVTVTGAIHLALYTLSFETLKDW